VQPAATTTSSCSLSSPTRGVSGAAPDEIAGGLMEIPVIYEALGDLDEAQKLLHRALRLLDGSSREWSIVVSVVAQMGVLYYMVGRYANSGNSFKSAVAKSRAIGERKSTFFAFC
jgi:tetratricopeptide (TPR) repeat protein